jgi:hypothetical protein
MTVAPLESRVESVSTMKTPSPSQWLTRAALVVAMALGSIALWLAMPVFWLWFASQLQSSSQPSMTPYLVVLAGIIISAFAITKLLAAADRAYGRVGGAAHTRRRLPWNRSMRGEREVDARAPDTVLTRVMVISVSIALALFGLWFFLSAGSSLPT